MPKVIVNTTPLIALANVGKLDLLRKLYGEIRIPEAVVKELVREPARSQVLSADWIKIIPITQPETKGLFRARLHAGEVEVTILAQEENADLVIIDDNAAKKTAKFLGLKVTGTLGILIRAKEKGYLDAVKPVMEKLINDGLFIGDDVYQLVLKAAGE